MLLLAKSLEAFKLPKERKIRRKKLKIKRIKESLQPSTVPVSTASAGLGIVVTSFT